MDTTYFVSYVGCYPTSNQLRDIYGSTTGQLPVINGVLSVFCHTYFGVPDANSIKLFVVGKAKARVVFIAPSAIRCDRVAERASGLS